MARPARTYPQKIATQNPMRSMSSFEPPKYSLRALCIMRGFRQGLGTGMQAAIREGPSTRTGSRQSNRLPRGIGRWCSCSWDHTPNRSAQNRLLCFLSHTTKSMAARTAGMARTPRANVWSLVLVSGFMRAYSSTIGPGFKGVLAGKNRVMEPHCKVYTPPSEGPII